ncbi:MAG: HAD family hydrolase [Candidatus Nanoarchaeia archaeon]
MIKNIIFDLNKVIVTYENQPNKKELDEEYKRLVGMTQDEFWEKAKIHFDFYNEGTVDFTGFMKIVFDELKISYEKIPMVKKLHKRSFNFVEGIENLLIKLRKNFNLFFCAGDGFESAEMKIKDFGLEKHFKRIYVSCHEKSNKKNAFIYKKILQENNLKPGETIFIDDLNEHIKACRKTGIYSIQFKNVIELKEELATFGIFI